MPEQLQLSKPAASVDIVTGTKSRIALVRKVPGKLTPEQDAVLALLEAAHAPDARLSQRDIARSAAWLGCHPKHEAEVVANEFESTTRQVRDIIRQLRLEHLIPVLSDRGGYFLPSSQGEADSYIKRMESEARARAAASMVTYNVMKHTLGVTSAFFEAIAAVDAPKAAAAPKIVLTLLAQQYGLTVADLVERQGCKPEDVIVERPLPLGSGPNDGGSVL